MVYPPIALMTRGLETLYIFMYYYCFGGRQHILRRHHVELNNCDECGKDLWWREDPKDHFGAVHEGWFPQCDECEKGSGGGEDLETTWVFFMKSVSNRCGECGKDLWSWEDLREHLDSAHEGYILVGLRHFGSNFNLRMISVMWLWLVMIDALGRIGLLFAQCGFHLDQEEVWINLVCKTKCALYLDFWAIFLSFNF